MDTNSGCCYITGMLEDVLFIAIWLLVLTMFLVVPVLVIRRATRRLSPRHQGFRYALMAFPPTLVLLGIAFIATFGVLPKGGTRWEPADSLPTFPWPPPEPSARLVIPGSAFRGNKTFGELSASFDEALTKTGHVERSYYAVPGGIGIVTRLERIQRDGSPSEGSNRWQFEDAYLQTLSPTSYLARLFTVSEGYYRVVVFAVTDMPFGSAEKPLTPVKANTLLARGFNTLPENVAAKTLPTGFVCTCLIYEFLRERGKAAVQLFPGRLDAKRHLVASGLWVAFGWQ